MNNNLIVNLKKKHDGLILSDLRALVYRERENLTRILHYLREVEARRLYLARGYSSLFAMMTEELGYSEAAAQRRIYAMRLLKEVPEVERDIQSGEISLSVASQMQSFFRKEKERRIRGKQAPIEKNEKLGLIEKLKGASTRECERKLIEINPVLNLPKEKTRPLTEDKTLIQFTADQTLMAKIERLKSLLSHSNPEGALDRVFARALDLALDKLDPKRREERRRSRRQGASAAPRPRALKSPGAVAGEGRKALPAPEVKGGERSRHIPTRIRDKIWVRDKGRCQYRNGKTGKLCGSQHHLEVDHCYPYSLGGEHSESNLRLLCRKHNQFRALELFG